MFDPWTHEPCAACGRLQFVSVHGLSLVPSIFCGVSTLGSVAVREICRSSESVSQVGSPDLDILVGSLLQPLSYQPRSAFGMNHCTCATHSSTKQTSEPTSQETGMSPSMLFYLCIPRVYMRKADPVSLLRTSPRERFRHSVSINLRVEEHTPCSYPLASVVCNPL